MKQPIPLQSSRATGRSLLDRAPVCLPVLQLPSLGLAQGTHLPLARAGPEALGRCCGLGGVLVLYGGQSPLGAL